MISPSWVPKKGACSLNCNSSHWVRISNCVPSVLMSGHSCFEMPDMTNLSSVLGLMKHYCLHRMSEAFHCLFPSPWALGWHVLYENLHHCLDTVFSLSTNTQHFCLTLAHSSDWWKEQSMLLVRPCFLFSSSVFLHMEQQSLVISVNLFLVFVFVIKLLSKSRVS